MTAQDELELELLSHIRFDKDGGVSAKEITDWVIKDRKRIIEEIFLAFELTLR